MYLPSVGAWGSNPATVSPSDLKYMHFWRTARNDPRESYYANHVLAYYAPPQRGRRLVEMIPEDSLREMTEDAERIRESLIGEASRKCEEGFANAGWIGATYLKVQDGIIYLDGGWTKLSPSQASKLQNLILFARAKTQCLDGREKKWLHSNMGGVESTLLKIERYHLHEKIYRGR